MNKDRQVNLLEAEIELLTAQLIDGNQEYQRVVTLMEELRAELQRERSLRVSYEKQLEMAGLPKSN